MKGVRHITVVAGLLWLAASGPAFAQGGVRRPPRRRVEPSPTSRDRGPIGYMRIDRTRAGPAYRRLQRASHQRRSARVCRPLSGLDAEHARAAVHLYTSQYIVMGPQNLRIEPDVDPISGAIVALHMTGTVDRAPHTVWMDGRPHPSKNAPHTAGGFSTGVWQGGMDRRTDHALEGGARVAQRRPAQRSGHHLGHYARHGDLLTITMILTDPIYYEEPFIRNATFELDSQTRVLPEP